MIRGLFVKNKVRILFLIVCLFAVSSIAVAQTPKRIVSLKPNITELIFALGAGENVVGVTSWCDWPLEVKKLPKVADYIHADIEKIIALKPDLIVGSKENSDTQAVRQLQQLGFNVVLLQFETIQDFYGSTLSLGPLLGRSDAATKLVLDVKSGVAAVQKGIAGRAAPRALIVVGKRPLIVAGANTFLDELLKAVNVVNIADGAKIRYPNMSLETIIAKRPDVIIDLTMGDETKKTMTTDSIFDNMKTVYLPIEKMRSGPRLPESLRILAEAIY